MLTDVKLDVPMLTVLMPNYNNGAFLREAIDSVLAQSFPDFRFLIVDDGSSDNSIEIIESYQDQRIHLIRKEKNSGIVDTLNLGIEHISSKYFVRMDGDDISAPDRFKLLVEFMEQNPHVGVCGSHIQLFGDLNDVWKMELDPERIKAKLIYTNSVSHAPSIMRTMVLKEHGVFYRNVHPYMEDFDLFFRLKNLTEFAHLDKVLYHYRILAHNSTVRNQHTAQSRRRGMYKQILTELEIEPSEKNIDLHIQLFVGDIPVTYPIAEYRRWINTLLSSNDRLSIYPKQMLHDFLAESWNGFFYKLVPMPISKSLTFFFHSRIVRWPQFTYLFKVKLNSVLKGNRARKF